MPLDDQAKTSIIAGQWDQICRLAASLEARTVTPSALLRSLQRGPNPSSLGRALSELGRIVKALHVLDYCHDPIYRRAVHRLLGRGESRNSLARDVFHGQRGPAPPALPGRSGEPARRPRPHG
ncbi:MAG: Tn3 family transposase, partial [Acidimicrobiales bacterium]